MAFDWESGQQWLKNRPKRPLAALLAWGLWLRGLGCYDDCSARFLRGNFGHFEGLFG